MEPMNLDQRMKAHHIATEAGYSQAEQDQPDYESKQGIISLARGRERELLATRGQAWTRRSDQSRDFLIRFQVGYEEQIRMRTLLTQLQIVAIRSVRGSERHGISSITLIGAEREEILYMRDAYLS